ncbi:hypothetical protein K458DRAFT_435411 [Lentithecium fluviatile CBS 122367]|uniref:Uncharacterized protein n=1 Tax=Lentithecium fluviatile CBS 122367 TaxID=1168545 RepID=A0A6G1IL54_9PLEO|nr:hypothetical protein K458DRAFT_435411 [Lentithecium fluviatile CBS 122367]
MAPRSSTPSFTSTLMDEADVATIQQAVLAALAAALPQAVQSTITAFRSVPTVACNLPVTALSQQEDIETLILRGVQEDGFLALKDVAQCLRFLPVPADLSGIVPERVRGKKTFDLTDSFVKLFQEGKKDRDVTDEAVSPNVARALALIVERRSLLIAGGVAEAQDSRFHVYRQHINHQFWPLYREIVDGRNLTLAQRIVTALVARQYPEKVSVPLSLDSQTSKTPASSVGSCESQKEAEEKTTDDSKPVSSPEPASLVERDENADEDDYPEILRKADRVRDGDDEASAYAQPLPAELWDGECKIFRDMISLERATGGQKISQHTRYWPDIADRLESALWRYPPTEVPLSESEKATAKALAGEVEEPEATFVASADAAASIAEVGHVCGNPIALSDSYAESLPENAPAGEVSNHNEVDIEPEAAPVGEASDGSEVDLTLDMAYDLPISDSGLTTPGEPVDSTNRISADVSQVLEAASGELSQYTLGNLPAPSEPEIASTGLRATAPEPEAATLESEVTPLVISVEHQAVVPDTSDEVDVMYNIALPESGLSTPAEPAEPDEPAVEETSESLADAPDCMAANHVLASEPLQNDPSIVQATKTSTPEGPVDILFHAQPADTPTLESIADPPSTLSQPMDGVEWGDELGALLMAGLAEESPEEMETDGDANQGQNEGSEKGYEISGIQEPNQSDFPDRTVETPLNPIDQDMDEVPDAHACAFDQQPLQPFAPPRPIADTVLVEMQDVPQPFNHIQNGISTLQNLGPINSENKALEEIVETAELQQRKQAHVPAEPRRISLPRSLRAKLDRPTIPATVHHAVPAAVSPVTQDQPTARPTTSVFSSSQPVLAPPAVQQQDQSPSPTKQKRPSTRAVDPALREAEMQDVASPAHPDQNASQVRSSPLATQQPDATSSLAENSEAAVPGASFFETHNEGAAKATISHQKVFKYPSIEKKQMQEQKAPSRAPQQGNLQMNLQKSRSFDIARVIKPAQAPQQKKVSITDSEEHQAIGMMRVKKLLESLANKQRAPGRREHMIIPEPLREEAMHWYLNKYRAASPKYTWADLQKEFSCILENMDRDPDVWKRWESASYNATSDLTLKRVAPAPSRREEVHVSKRYGYLVRMFEAISTKNCTLGSVGTIEMMSLLDVWKLAMDQEYHCLMKCDGSEGGAFVRAYHKRMEAHCRWWENSEDPIIGYDKWKRDQKEAAIAAAAPNWGAPVVARKRVAHDQPFELTSSNTPKRRCDLEEEGQEDGTLDVSSAQQAPIPLAQSSPSKKRSVDDDDVEPTANSKKRRDTGFETGGN